MLIQNKIFLHALFWRDMQLMDPFQFVKTWAFTFLLYIRVLAFCTSYWEVTTNWDRLNTTSRPANWAAHRLPASQSCCSTSLFYSSWTRIDDCSPQYDMTWVPFIRTFHCSLNTFLEWRAHGFSCTSVHQTQFVSCLISHSILFKYWYEVLATFGDESKPMDTWIGSEDADHDLID